MVGTAYCRESLQALREKGIINACGPQLLYNYFCKGFLNGNIDNDCFSM